eukprot:7388309-Prymnesium_polylepis.1
MRCPRAERAPGVAIVAAAVRHPGRRRRRRTHACRAACSHRPSGCPTARRRAARATGSVTRQAPRCSRPSAARTPNGAVRPSS